MADLEIEDEDLIEVEKDEEIKINVDEPQQKISDVQNNIITEEKLMLKDMGFEEELINTIYKNIHPINLQEALDYLNKNEKGQFTHSFLVNENNVCTICGKGRKDHESDTLFVEDNPNDEFNDEDLNTSLFFFDDLLNNTNNNNNNNSNRFRAYENSYKNSLNNNSKNKNNPKECLICFESIESPNKVKLKCGHYFCESCWVDYLKEKISNANVVKIKCMQHGCDIVLDNDFIKNMLEGNNELIEKYDKFYNRKKMIEKNDKIKLCPFPDCEGYAEKKGKNKYVKCNFGHEFCFECGNAPHGKKKCEDMVDKEFEEWRSHKIVKRCPYCRMWTEKNEGCNHMTCVECQFQWCWLCQKPYNSNHFNEGSCNGLQFYKETDEKIIKAKLEENRKRFPDPLNYQIYFFNFLKCIGFIFFFFFIHMILRSEKHFRNISNVIPGFYFLSFIPIFISFEFMFVAFVVIGSIPYLVYPPFFRRLKFYITYRLFQTCT